MTEANQADAIIYRKLWNIIGLAENLYWTSFVFTQIQDGASKHPKIIRVNQTSKSECFYLGGLSAIMSYD